MKRPLHIVPGLDDPCNGIAVAAKLIAGGQDATLVDMRTFTSEQIAAASEVWVHSMWMPQVWHACRAVKAAGCKLVRMTHANLDPVRLAYHGWKKRLVSPIEHRLLRQADEVVATCEAEAEWIRTSACPVETFTQFWTKKEAVLKLRGTGISTDLHQVLDGMGYRLETFLEREKRYAWSVAYSD